MVGTPGPTDGPVADLIEGAGVGGSVGTAGARLGLSDAVSVGAGDGDGVSGISVTCKAVTNPFTSAA